MGRRSLRCRAGLGLALCLGGAPLSSLAWDADDGRSGLLDLAPQTFPVKAPVKLTPLPLPAADESPDAQTPSEHVQYGLLPLQSLTRYRYGAGWTSRWVDGTGAQPATMASLSPVATTGIDAWSRGARNWRYVSSLGYGLTVGNAATPVASWSSGDPVRLAGVGLYRTMPTGRGDASEWRYTVAVGALDLGGDGTVASGGLEYGPTAYEATTSYAVSSRLSIASRVQGTQDLLALGLGAEYALGRWGSWALGVSQARRATASGWDYQLGYQVQLLDALNLSWTREGRSAGYGDLSTYNVVLGCHCVRNQWQLSAPTGAGGQFSGRFEQRHRAVGGLEQRVGLVQSVQYGSSLQVSLEANRNLLSGDYGVGAWLSVPLD